ncbi:hypothetical protein CspeluHIS016_0302700 [Cutaneotrichosporon spelunceum]|uniref:Uncharacterized protein n=1 Tax=Cutaneotrichosporon spelunceum TaxID=1672016 RepID=A0AAD3TT72_9TREE|nr:hypothetical protein CspeluHIS016_0302700 [Cutaneotrichosporon spelunceum]
MSLTKSFNHMENIRIAFPDVGRHVRKSHWLEIPSDLPEDTQVRALYRLAERLQLMLDDLSTVLGAAPGTDVAPSHIRLGIPFQLPDRIREPPLILERAVPPVSLVERGTSPVRIHTSRPPTSSLRSFLACDNNVDGAIHTNTPGPSPWRRSPRSSDTESILSIDSDSTTSIYLPSARESLISPSSITTVHAGGLVVHNRRSLALAMVGTPDVLRTSFPTSNIAEPFTIRNNLTALPRDYFTRFNHGSVTPAIGYNHTAASIVAKSYATPGPPGVFEPLPLGPGTGRQYLPIETSLEVNHYHAQLSRLLKRLDTLRTVGGEPQPNETPPTSWLRSRGDEDTAEHSAHASPSPLESDHQSTMQSQVSAASWNMSTGVTTASYPSYPVSTSSSRSHRNTASERTWPPSTSDYDKTATGNSNRTPRSLKAMTPFDQGPETPNKGAKDQGREDQGEEPEAGWYRAYRVSANRPEQGEGTKPTESDEAAARFTSRRLRLGFRRFSSENSGGEGSSGSATIGADDNAATGFGGSNGWGMVSHAEAEGANTGPRAGKGLMRHLARKLRLGS